MRRSKLHEVESAFAEFLFKEWENFHNKVLEYVGWRLSDNHDSRKYDIVEPHQTLSVALSSLPKFKHRSPE